jgi:uncharacterized Zn-binding protein involved in type VI secretion
MAKVQRVGDPDSGGGRIIRGDNTVQVNGKPVAVVNVPVTPHPNNRPPHTNARTRANKNTTVRANGKLIVVTGDTDTCGHVRVGGSPNVNIG